MGFPVDSVVKNLPAREGDAGSIPGLGRFPGGGNGNPLQYSCLENFMDRRAWRATVHEGNKESDMTEQLHFHFSLGRRKWQPTPVFLPGEYQGRGSLVGCRLWGCTESDTTEET